MSNSSGALTELAALGNQDAFLSIKPEKTFFAQSYRRHTNFAIAEQDLIIDSVPSGAWTGKKCVCRVQRNGDLLGWCYFSASLSALGLDPDIPLTEAIWGAGNVPASATAAEQETRLFWCNAVGHVMISRVSFEVGSQVVDEWTSDFLHLWEKMTGKAGKQLQEMIGQFDSEEDMRDFAALDRRLYVPLPFYFARAYALHTPLIALQYHETRITLTLKSRSELVVRFRGGSVAAFRDELIDLAYVTGGEMTDANITANYVYLDTMERRVFAQQPHEYLITQVQYHGSESVPASTPTKQVQVHFNHPVLELFIVYAEDQQSTVEYGFRYFNYGVEYGAFLPHQDTSTAVIPLVDPISTMSLQLNGHDRITTREAAFFRMVPAWERHSNIPDRFIYNYCFCLYPEEDSSPSGSLNMSRIDNVVFRFAFVNIGGGTGLEYPGQLRIFARNFNVISHDVKSIKPTEFFVVISGINLLTANEAAW